MTMTLCDANNPPMLFYFQFFSLKENVKRKVSLSNVLFTLCLHSLSQSALHQ